MKSWTAAPRTFSQILDSFPHAPVKGSGVRWTLEGQAAPPVFHFPVMKGGSGYGVDQVLPQWTVQDHLFDTAHREENCYGPAP